MVILNVIPRSSAVIGSFTQILKKRRLLRWVLLGIPIYLLNYLIFGVVLWLSSSTTLAYWSWPVAAPLTLKMWDIMEKRGGHE
jgi:hypothetical protein